MVTYFNIYKNFNNSYLFYSDTSVKITKEQSFALDDFSFTVLFDDNNKIHSITFFGNIFENELTKDYGFLTIEQEAKLKDIVYKANPNFIFNENKHYEYGLIIKRENHAKSDKLFVLEISFPQHKKQILTNTLYTLEGKVFPFFLAGSITAKGLAIVNSEIMGIKSEGMLASNDSLGISEHEYDEQLKIEIEKRK
ncbi:TyrS-associated PheT N-terminal domain-related protein TapR [Mycoplasmopsis opalescens]|uniref:TyrS-associated PheT N-terminal domain-related protein TapR n=1 Tax=Mycoplasmopsis opalescens TaxID=114886 RepID=UPI00068B1665|nr:hypothetical protein [Mycoplasmopsis opalescens]